MFVCAGAPSFRFFTNNQPLSTFSENPHYEISNFGYRNFLAYTEQFSEESVHKKLTKTLAPPALPRAKNFAEWF